MIKFNKNWKISDKEFPYLDENNNQKLEIEKYYLYNTFLYQYRIRFVKYNKNVNEIDVFIIKINKLYKLYNFFYYPLLILMNKFNLGTNKYYTKNSIPNMFFYNAHLTGKVEDCEKLFKIKL